MILNREAVRGHIYLIVTCRRPMAPVPVLLDTSFYLQYTKHAQREKDHMFRDLQIDFTYIRQ